MNINIKNIAMCLLLTHGGLYAADDSSATIPPTTDKQRFYTVLVDDILTLRNENEALTTHTSAFKQEKNVLVTTIKRYKIAVATLGIISGSMLIYYNWQTITTTLDKLYNKIEGLFKPKRRKKDRQSTSSAF